MSQAKDAVTLQADSLNKLIDVLTNLLTQNNVSREETAKAKADLALLIQEDTETAQSVTSMTNKLNDLVDKVSAAIVPESDSDTAA
jgi:hypothetical protein